jgi:hypothetical protein
MVAFISWLEHRHACEDATGWLWRSGLTPAEAWEACERADWLLWLAGKAGVAEKEVVLATCAVARLALKWLPPGEDRSPKAVEVAERWAREEPGLTRRHLCQARSSAEAAYLNAGGRERNCHFGGFFATLAARRAVLFATGSAADAAATVTALYAAASAHDASTHDAARGETARVRLASATAVRAHLRWVTIVDTMRQDGGGL